MWIAARRLDVAIAYDMPKSVSSTISKNRAAIEDEACEQPNTDGRRIWKKCTTRWRKRSTNGPRTSMHATFQSPVCRCGARREILHSSSRLRTLLQDQGGCGGFEHWYSIVGKSRGLRGVRGGRRRCREADRRQPITVKYEPLNIFEADETALYRQLRPNRTSVHQNENCHGGKTSESRITTLPMTNVDRSSKLGPLVVGRFESPRCLREYSPPPVPYTLNRKAWMTRTLFKKRLWDWDEEQVCLLLEKRSAHHCGVSLNNIESCFSPLNATALLRPLN